MGEIGNMVNAISNFYDENLVFNHIIYKDLNVKNFPTHSHNLCEFLFVKRANASYVIENREYHLKENDLIFIRPQTYHYIKFESPQDYERYNLTFNSWSLKIDLDMIPEGAEIFHCKKDGIIENLFKKLDYYCHNLNKNIFAEILSYVSKELVYNISLEKNAEQPSVHLSTIVHNAVKYMNDNLFSIKDIKEVSNAIYVSQNYLFNVFKKQMKISPKKYLTEKRLLFAQNMINLGRRPTEIYTDCGFTNYPTFYRAYVNFFGHAPSQELNSHNSAN